MEDVSGSGQTLVVGSPGGVALASALELPQVTDCMEQCVHFWVIAPPNGPTSQGICKLCGKRQEFRNSVSSSAWNKGVAK